MNSYEVVIGGERKRASEILRSEDGIGGVPEVLSVIGDIYVGGRPAETVWIRLFQLASRAELADVEEALEKCCLGHPTQEMAIRSAKVLSDEILQQGDVVFSHTEPVHVPADGHMLENLIVLGWSKKAGVKELILRLKGMEFPPGTNFAGVVHQE